ncbi:unnamed protein product, partial [Plutella xylostella]
KTIPLAHISKAHEKLAGTRKYWSANASRCLVRNLRKTGGGGGGGSLMQKPMYQDYLMFFLYPMQDDFSVYYFIYYFSSTFCFLIFISGFIPQYKN